MAKKIKNIGAKRERLSNIFRARNLAVAALDKDDETAYKEAIADLKGMVDKIEAI